MIRRAQPWGLLVAATLIGAAPAAGGAENAETAALATAPGPAASDAAGQRADPGPGPDNPATQASRQPRRTDARAHAGGTIEARVAFYAKELNLDAHQQSALRALLAQQRQLVQRLWSDTTMPAAQLIQATKAIEDATSDRIRAMLNDEQRKKYNPPRPPHDKLIEAQSTSVEDWMGIMSSRQSN